MRRRRHSLVYWFPACPRAAIPAGARAAGRRCSQAISGAEGGQAGASRQWAVGCSQFEEIAFSPAEGGGRPSVLPSLQVEALAVSHESIVISWNALAAAQSYRLWRRSPDSDWQQLILVPADVTRHVDQDLQPETGHEYKVEALDTAP